jgi:hypothetical protein
MADLNLTRTIAVSACAGCKKVMPVNGLSLCETWSTPWAKHRLIGGCPSQTNKVRVFAEKKIVNALKASKRAAAGQAAK